MKPQREPEQEPDDKKGIIPLTDPEYGIWMKAHPEFMLALLEVTQDLFDEKYPTATPEEQATMKQVHDEFRNEMGNCYINETYNPLIDRINRIDPTYVLDEEELEEVKSCSKALDELVDVALVIFEPERTRYLTHLINTRDYVRKILAAQ